MYIAEVSQTTISVLHFHFKFTQCTYCSICTVHKTKWKFLRSPNLILVSVLNRIAYKFLRVGLDNASNISLSDAQLFNQVAVVVNKNDFVHTGDKLKCFACSASPAIEICYMAT